MSAEAPVGELPVAGAVLVGGASRRMGTDKAWLEVDGVALARRVGDALAAAGCDPVLLVGGRDDGGDDDGGRERVADRFPGEGPVGGVITAVAAASERAPSSPVVVAACDLPWLDAGTVRSLVVAARDHPECDVVAAFSSGRHVPLACWGPAALGSLERHFAGGVRSWGGVLERLRVHRVDISPVAAIDVDTPDELRSARDAAGSVTDHGHQ